MFGTKIISAEAAAPSLPVSMILLPPLATYTRIVSRAPNLDVNMLLYMEWNHYRLSILGYVKHKELFQCLPQSLEQGSGVPGR